MHYILSWLFILYLFLPTFLANAAPIIVKNIPLLRSFKKPISEKYLWKNKTYRWFIAGILFWTMVSILQYYFTQFGFVDTVIEKYFEVITSLEIAIIAWFLQGFWALLWDAVKSFFKRKIGIKPGEPWPIFDGIDYVLWSAILFAPIFFPSIIWVIFLCCIWPIASLIANIGAYIIRWKDVWY